MKLDQMFPRLYATGSDLAGKPVTLTIASVTTERMRPNPKAPEEEKFVLHFEKTEKGVILSRTLAAQIATIHGDETDAWTSKRITLYPVPMRVAGVDRVAIRARAPAATNGTEPPVGLQDTEEA